MKIKSSHFIIGSLAVVALANGENVRSAMQKNTDIRQEQASFSDRIRQNRTEARQAEKLSKVALDRYKANCILVVDDGSSKEAYFQPAQKVIDTQLGQTLRPGVPVCNKLGDTAVVSEAGTLTDIARVSVPDQPQFLELLKQRR